MGIDHSFQNLMAAPDIKTVADLRGKQLAVDALTTGFAFVLREMISRAFSTVSPSPCSAAFAQVRHIWDAAFPPFLSS
mgnify:CR=1 FL=1